MADSETFQVEYSAHNSTTPPSPIDLEDLINLFTNNTPSFIDGTTIYTRKDLTSEVLEKE